MKINSVAQYQKELRMRGIRVPGNKILTESALQAEIAKYDNMMANDALYYEVNNAVPALLNAYINPQEITILETPLGAEKIQAPVKRGVMGQGIMLFELWEYTGEVAPYSDWNSAGSANYNNGYEQRNEYTFQLTTRFGDLEADKGSLAGFSVAQRIQEASARTMKKAHNRFYFYGVDGINYGIMNDPGLLPALTPANIGGRIEWADKTAQEIYDDIVAMYTQLVEQTDGIVGDGITEMDNLTLIMPPILGPQIKKTELYFEGTVQTQLQANFPNIRIITVPEFRTAAGNVVALVADNLEGNPSFELAFTELYRAHGLVRDLSGSKEKKSAGTWGGIITQPLAWVRMIGA